MVDNNNLDSFENTADSFSPDIDLDSFLADLDISFSPENFSDDFPVADNSEAESHSSPILKNDFNVPAPKIKAPVVSYPEDDEPDEEHTSKGSSHRILNICLLLVALLLIGGIAGVIFMNQNADPLDNRILQNVTIAGVNVGGMTKEEALQAIRVNVGGAYFETDMVVKLGRAEVVLPVSQTNANFNINAAVNAAYDLGRSGTVEERQRTYKIAQSMPITIDITSALGLNTAYIRNAIEEAVKGFDGGFVQSSYVIDGEMPGLSAEEYDKSAPCQTLQLTVGNPGSGANVDSIYNCVIEAYSQRNFHVDVPNEYLGLLPDDLNLDAIFAELNIEPVEAVEKADTLEVIPGSSGYTFDLENARKLLSAAHYGDQVSIPMEYALPTHLDFNGSFTELLGTFSTPVEAKGNYLNNMKLLCKTIDKTVIEPGKVYSLNNAAPRTTENGYKKTSSHPNYCILTEIGGGSDQVATTLYVAAMLADLSIVEKHQADHACGYTTKGTEICVNQSWLDLKIRNDYDTPVKIRAKASGSKIVVEIYGQKAPDYYIKLETEETYVIPASTSVVYRKETAGYAEGDIVLNPIDGASLNVHLIKISKATEQEISRESFYAEVRPVPKTTATLQK